MGSLIGVKRALAAIKSENGIPTAWDCSSDYRTICIKARKRYTYGMGLLIVSLIWGLGAELLDEKSDEWDS